MSILDQPNTPANPAKASAMRITNSVRQTYNQLLNTYNNCMSQVWSNPNGATPQQVLAALGTSAAEVANHASNLRDFLNTANPSLNLPSTTPAPLTINSDGTVIVGTPG